MEKAVVLSCMAVPVVSKMVISWSLVRPGSWPSSTWPSSPAISCWVMIPSWRAFQVSPLEMHWGIESTITRAPLNRRVAQGLPAGFGQGAEGGPPPLGVSGCCCP